MRLEAAIMSYITAMGKVDGKQKLAWVKLQTLTGCVSPQVKPLGRGGVGGVGIRFMNMENIFKLSAYNNLCSTLSGMISDKILSWGQWSLMHAQALLLCWTHPELWLPAPPQTRWCWPSSCCRHPPVQESLAGWPEIALTPSLGPSHRETPRTRPARRGGCRTGRGPCWSRGTWTSSTASTSIFLGLSQIRTATGHFSQDICNDYN